MVFYANIVLLLVKRIIKLNSTKQALTLIETIIAVGVLIFSLYVTLPAVNFTKPTSVAVKYTCMYIKLQENALKVIDGADYEEHYSPFMLAAVSGNEMCTHISQQFDTKGTVICNGEGSYMQPNFYLYNKTSWWGLGGLDYKIPISDFDANCSNPDSGYNCYKTVYVDLNSHAGLNRLGSDIFRIRLRFDGKVDTLPEWNDENTLLESL